jgi:hypothetical protein
MRSYSRHVGALSRKIHGVKFQNYKIFSDKIIVMEVTGIYAVGNGFSLRYYPDICL